MKANLEEWQVHALMELGRILAYLLDSETPDSVAIQLEAIARDLRHCFMTNDPLITPSTRPEINALRKDL
jgi:hypothetical protein